MAKCEDFVYLPLVDAREAVDLKVNLFAVVVEIGCPTRSRGTRDYLLELRIADQSHMASDLSVNFFAESTAKLPRVVSPGDIICLRRVVPRVYEGEVCFDFEKNLSLFALFDGKCDSSFNIYQASYDFYAVEHDMELIKMLRTWSLNYRADADAKNCTLQLKELEVDREIDLICKVLHVCEAGEEEEGQIFYVWDGTDYPPLPVQTDLDSEISHPIPLRLEISPPPIDVLCLFPHVGSILRLTSGKFPKEIILSVGGKHWVKFRKIICEHRWGIWSGMLCNSSKVSALSDEDEAVLLRERNYNQRIMSARLRRPMSCFSYMFSVTETDFFHLVDATLMDSLAHPEFGLAGNPQLQVCGARRGGLPMAVERFHLSGTRAVQAQTHLGGSNGQDSRLRLWR